MTINLNAQFVEQAKIVAGLCPVTPSTSTPDYVSLKNYEKLTIVILVDNATTVTGSAITVKQATAVAGTSEKAVSFTTAYRNIDIDAADTLSSFTVSSDTFTTDATNNKNLLYVIEVNASDLDVANGFDCVRVDSLLMANAVGYVQYILHGARYASPLAVAAITD